MIKVSYSKPGSDHLQTEEYEADKVEVKENFVYIVDPMAQAHRQILAMFNPQCVVKIDFGEPTEPVKALPSAKIAVKPKAK